MAKTIDDSFKTCVEPIDTRAAWDAVRDSVEKGMCSYTLNCGQELTGIAEANTQQTFMDILDKDVIGPLTTLKVRQGCVFCTEILNEGQSGRN